MDLKSIEHLKSNPKAYSFMVNLINKNNQTVVKPVAKKAKKILPLGDAIKSINALVEGMDGWISEQGEDGLWLFWKRDVLDRCDKASKVPINRQQGLELLNDLIEGLEGVVSEQGEVPNRYWKKTVLITAKARAKVLKQAIDMNP